MRICGCSSGSKDADAPVASPVISTKTAVLTEQPHRTSEINVTTQSGSGDFLATHPVSQSSNEEIALPSWVLFTQLICFLPWVY